MTLQYQRDHESDAELVLTQREWDAIMRASIHDDGRGAYFAQADKDAICTLYPDARLTADQCAER